MKKYLSGIIVVVLAIGMTAYTNEKKAKSPAGEKWFHFIGSNSVPSDLTNPNKYVLDGSGANPTICLSPNTYRCEIKIMPQSGDPSKPDLAGHTPVAETGRTTP